MSSWWDDFTSFFSSSDTSGNTLTDSAPVFYGDNPNPTGIPTVADGSDFDYSILSGGVDPTPDSKDKGPWYTNPSVIGAGITAGAGLFSNMSALDQKDRDTKAALEQQKMMNLVELAKLKNSILAKQAAGSGGGRSGGGGSGTAQADKERANSVNQVNAYNNLGSTLAGIYKS